MNPAELIQPLNKLEKYETDVEIIQWLHKVQATCLDAPSSRAIISELIELRENDDVDRYDEKSPYYDILLAYSYAISEDIETAIEEVDSSVSGFKKFGEEKHWQQAISSWFHGLLLCKQGQHDSAKAKIDNSIKIISELADEQYRLGFYEKHKDLRDVIGLIEINRHKVEELKVSTPKNDTDSPLPQSKSRYNMEADKKQSASRELVKSGQKQKTQQKPLVNIHQEYKQGSGYIAIPWLPIFQSVSAGPNGIVIMDSLADVTLNTIEILNIPHELYSIKQMDRQITLNHILTYGLVKVEGNSMNGMTPVSIENGDYVLFYKQENSEENDIVIAWRLTPGGDFAYMVKRYKKSDNQ